MINYTDVVLDLSYGDCGKGAISSLLASSGQYNVVMRVSGGHNAGHTIHHNGKIVHTRVIPCGLLWGVESIIGSGCVLHVDSFLEEVESLKIAGYDTSLIKIADNCHIITDVHRAVDSTDQKVGTTKTGNGPAYSDKYARTGSRAADEPRLKEYLINLRDHLCGGKNHPFNVLVEGAQGFYLDVDYGNYPYVTSGHPTISSVFQNCIPRNSIRKVYGVIKAYETYVGVADFINLKGKNGARVFSNINSVSFRSSMSLIRELGREYGTNTGRSRQVDYVNFDDLKFSIEINGITDLLVTKCDIADQVFGFINDDEKSKNALNNLFSSIITTDHLCYITEGDRLTCQPFYKTLHNYFSSDSKYPTLKSIQERHGPLDPIL